MARDRLIAKHALRLLDDIEHIPEHPVGPHLDEEDFIGLARDSLTASHRRRVLEHVRSCLQCAEHAVIAPEALKHAHAARLDASTRRTRLQSTRQPPAPLARDVQVAQFAWIAATAAAWVAARRAPLRVRGMGRKRAPRWQQRDAGPFECAIGTRGSARILAVRTADRESTERPIRCVLKQRGKPALDVWLIVPAAGHDRGPHVGTVLLQRGAPRSRSWTVAVDVYTVLDQLPRDRLKLLKRAYAKAGGDTVRLAWSRWLEDRIQAGELTPADVAKITRST